MKKKITVLGSLTISFIVALFTTGSLAVTHAAEASDELSQFKNITYDIFGNAEIESCEYLFGLDNSSDYIYINFKDNGYVIYHKDSMEMLEYSPTGEGPYCGIEERKYYAGPSNYFIRGDKGFVNLNDDENLVVSESLAQSLAEQVDNLLTEGGSNSNNAPNIKDGSLIPATPPGTATAGYIKNAQYFTSDPMHGDNVHGTCGSVATQLLLEYNNYYNDRRIIAPEHLNGGWNNAKGNNDLFDVANYASPYQNPYVCSNPTTMTRTVLGSNLDYYQYIIGNIEPSALKCVDTVTEYTVDPAKTITTITVTKEYPDGTTELISTETKSYQTDDEKKGKERKHSHTGSSGSDVVKGLKNILKSRISENEFEIKHSQKLLSAVDSAPIKAEIDAGRPLIIGMQKSLGGYDHWVVGYGYQDYTYPSGHSSAGKTYSGYVVHFGWGSSDNNIWINKSWCNEYISLDIKHKHNLNIDTEKNIGNDKREIRCGECGYRTVDELYQLNDTGDTIVGCNYSPKGDIVIPSKINGVKITKLGELAFANQTDMTGIILPSSIEKIGKNAFSGCSALKNIQLPYELTSIDDGAFAGCCNSYYSFPSGSSTFSIQDNILYNKGQTEILHTGQISPEITVENTVTRIAPHAFDGNSNLHTVTFNGTPVIGVAAFANCINLTGLIFDFDETPSSVGDELLSGSNNAKIYVPYDRQQAFRGVFGTSSDLVTSYESTLFFDGGEVRQESQTVYYGQTLALPEWDIRGYQFDGWLDEENNYRTNKYRYMSKTSMTFTAWMRPKQFTITLDLNAGDAIASLGENEVLIGENKIRVTYGQHYSTNIIAQRRGYKLSGWKNREGALYMTASGNSCKAWDELEDITLYADWEAEYYEIFFLYSGTIVWLDDTLILSGGRITYGTRTTIAELSEKYAQSYLGLKEGHVFSKFELDKSDLDSSGLPDFGEEGIRAVLKPVWQKKQFTLILQTGIEGGIGSIEMVIAYDEEISLPSPTRRGYEFLYWEDSEGIAFDYDKMPDLAPDSLVISYKYLYAKWDAYNYSVAYNANGGSGGKYMTNTSFRYDEEKNLTVNDYYRTGYEFTGWARTAGGAVEFTDGQKVSNLTDEQNGYVMLYAIWKPATYSIICKNLAAGWTTSYAKFTYGVGMNEMPVIYTANIGGRYYTLETFEGWYTSTDFRTQVTRISSTQAGDVTVYAKYYISVENFTDPDTYQVTDDDDLNKQPYFEINFNLGSYQYERIKNTTLKSIRIEISLDIWEVDDGYQECFLFCGNTQVWEQTIEHGPGKKNGTPKRYALNIPLFAIQDYASQDYFTLRFGAHGFSKDTWRFNNLEVHVSLVNDA